MCFPTGRSGRELRLRQVSPTISSWFSRPREVSICLGSVGRQRIRPHFLWMKFVMSAVCQDDVMMVPCSSAFGPFRSGPYASTYLNSLRFTSVSYLRGDAPGEDCRRLLRQHDGSFVPSQTGRNTLIVPQHRVTGHFELGGTECCYISNAICPQLCQCGCQLSQPLVSSHFH